MKKTTTITKENLIRKLKNMSITYLQRYSSTSLNLEKYLRKKVKEYNKEELQENPDIMIMFNEAISEVIKFLENLGYLNDKLYTEIQLRNLLNKGKSVNALKFKLHEKGVNKENLSEVLSYKDKSYMELYAALKFLKKKSFGIYRKPLEEEQLNKKIEKEYASIMRGGFSYSLANKVINMNKEEIEDLIYSLEKELDL